LLSPGTSQAIYIAAFFQQGLQLNNKKAASTNKLDVTCRPKLEIYHEMLAEYGIENNNSTYK